MTEMSFIPEFSKAEERNKWIKDNAQFWTVIRKRKRRYERDECWSLDEAVQLAQRRLERDPLKQPLLIYAVAGGHDTLAATVHPDGVRAVE
jgi:hypothetical protein